MRFDFTGTACAPPRPGGPLTALLRIPPFLIVPSSYRCIGDCLLSPVALNRKKILFFCKAWEATLYVSPRPLQDTFLSPEGSSLLLFLMGRSHTEDQWYKKLSPPCSANSGSYSRRIVFGVIPFSLLYLTRPPVSPRFCSDTCSTSLILFLRIFDPPYSTWPPWRSPLLLSPAG